MLLMFYLQIWCLCNIFNSGYLWTEHQKWWKWKNCCTHRAASWRAAE